MPLSISTATLPSPPTTASSGTKRALEVVSPHPPSRPYKISWTSRAWLPRYSFGEGIEVTSTGDANEDLCFKNEELRAAFNFRLAEHTRHCQTIEDLEQRLEKEQDKCGDLEARVEDMEKVLDTVRAMGAILSTPCLPPHTQTSPYSQTLKRA
ncbi:hypothetical protein BDP27DRAFT_1373192 [Rhodocollybia butyracea]|uniref:Uncharacterized protein n=1 Tax=Rhodocollybia butyracea TaxID=206335 RepID=A0A9P5TXC7_9AGAR|nr:hypothetical protein BDP27DRAFT_1373192 [Rhodocollybia butyracea]